MLAKKKLSNSRFEIPGDVRFGKESGAGLHRDGKSPDVKRITAREQDIHVRSKRKDRPGQFFARHFRHGEIKKRQIHFG